MHDVDIVLDNGAAVLEVEPVCMDLGVAAGEAEGAGAAAAGHLADVGERAVAAEHGDHAAVVRAGGENEVHGLQEARLGLVGRHLQVLGPAHGRRPGLGSLCQRVVMTFPAPKLVLDDAFGGPTTCTAVSDRPVTVSYRRK